MDETRTYRLRRSALDWMENEGPLLVDLRGPTEAACEAAKTMMGVCGGMADEGLCTEDIITVTQSVFAITDAGRKRLAALSH